MKNVRATVIMLYGKKLYCKQLALVPAFQSSLKEAQIL